MKLDNELEGLLVISLEQAVAAPYCGLLLANSGARVIKVERPEGDFARGYDAGADGQSTIFAWLNRGKESICLNLKDPNDMTLMRSMLSKADVFLNNLAPGAIARMGLDIKTLQQENPGLINCTISGYGESGAGAKKKAYDFLVQAEAGLCSVTGTAESPSRVGVSVTDISTGLTAYSAILRALIQRGRTGAGMSISLSMFDVVADWMNMPLMAHRYMGSAPGRTGLQHSFIAPYGAFYCGGGGQVLLSIQSNREWKIFCDQVLEMPQLATDERFCDNPVRYENREALNTIVNDVFSRHSTDAVIAMLNEAGIANGKLNSVAEFSDHEFLKNTDAHFGNTSINMAALPLQSSDPAHARVPELNGHGEPIRDEFSSNDENTGTST